MNFEEFRRLVLHNFSKIYLLPVQYEIFTRLLDEGQTFSNYVDQIKYAAAVPLLPVLDFFFVESNIGGLCTGQNVGSCFKYE